MANYFLAPAVNFLTKTLSGSLTDVATTITLSNTTNMLAPGYIVINRVNSSGTATPDNREVVYYTGISGSDLTGCTRGADGSTARAHADNSIVETMLTAGAWNSLTTITSTAIDSNGYLKAIASPVSIAIGHMRTLAVGSIASIARAEVGTLVTATFTASGRLTAGQLALVSIASSATQEFDIRNQDGHLDIRPGTNKLVKLPLLRQDNTTNAYQNNGIEQFGWGYMEVSSVQENEKAVTFPVPFSTAPIVHCTSLSVSGATPTAITDFISGPDNENLTWSVDARNISATGFTAGGRSSGAFGASKWLGFTWVARGQL